MNQAPPPAGGFGYGAPVGEPAFGPVIPPSPHAPSSTYAAWTLAAGIFSLLGLMICFIGVPFAVGSIAMGVHHTRRCNKYPDLYTGKGLAIAGAVCGAMSLVISALTLAALFLVSY
jgi:hypothetical protein